jgi:ABC-2 type transport system ATP-binding protein
VNTSETDVPPAIAAANIHVPGRLEDVSVTLQPGAAVALIGANGAGKSSLLHVLAGRLRAAQGSAHVVGVAPRARAAGRLRAYVPQRIELPAHLRVHEVLAAAAQLRGASRDVRDEAAERLGLHRVHGEPIGRLSGGMQQRVALAAGLMGAPPVWLLDEPASALDSGGLARLAAWVEAHVARGGTVLTSAHRPEEVEAFAEEAILMADGRVVARERVDALFTFQDRVSGFTLELDPGTSLRRTPSALLREVLEAPLGEDRSRPDEGKRPAARGGDHT